MAFLLICWHVYDGENSVAWIVSRKGFWVTKNVWNNLNISFLHKTWAAWGNVINDNRFFLSFTSNIPELDTSFQFANPSILSLRISRNKVHVHILLNLVALTWFLQEEINGRPPARILPSRVWLCGSHNELWRPEWPARCATRISFHELTVEGIISSLWKPALSPCSPVPEKITSKITQEGLSAGLLNSQSLQRRLHS